jgi:phenylpropionate dioxygenase-like ring-hydroxylating dioxygenase large terminal subunit
MDGTFCDKAILRDFWYAVALDAEVADSPVPVRLLGVDYVLWRNASGGVTAAADRCPHRESPLSPGVVRAGCIECPYHGWQFDGDGRCVKVPSASVGTPPPPRAHLAPIHSTIEYGLVWICPGIPCTSIPRIAQENHPAYRRLNVPVEVWKVSAGRMVDNFCDITHFPFVHTGTFGDAQETEVPAVALESLDDDFFGYAYAVEVANTDLGSTASGQSAAAVQRRMTTGFNLPFAVRSTIHYHTGLDHILLLLSTPIDDVTSLFTFVVWRNDDFSVPAEDILVFDLAIGAEDKRMLERVPGVLPLEQTALVSVQADRCSVEWRRRLRELLGSSPN